MSLTKLLRHPIFVSSLEKSRRRKMVVIDPGGGYTGPDFDYAFGVVSIRSLRSLGGGDLDIMYQLNLTLEVETVLRHILQVLMDNDYRLISVHQFDRVLTITIDRDHGNIDWVTLDRQADMTGGPVPSNALPPCRRESTRRRTPRS